jgi:hypothetical protein
MLTRSEKLIVLVVVFAATCFFKGTNAIQLFLEEKPNHGVCEINFDAPLWEFFDEKLLHTDYGYEKYNVTSEDGYILSLVRLVLKGESDKKRANRFPVLF